MLATEPVTLTCIVGPTKFRDVAAPCDIPSSNITTPLPDNTNESTCNSSIAIDELNEAEAELNSPSVVIESIISVLNSLNLVGVIKPELLFGKLVWFSCSNCVLFN